MSDNIELFIHRIITTLNWRLDVAGGELISQIINGLRYCKDYLVHPGTVSPEDLNSICTIVNNIFHCQESSLMVINNGEQIFPILR